MIRKVLLAIATVLALSTLISSPALAQAPQEERVRVDVTKFPELTSTRYGVFWGDNLLNPNSPNYDPSLRYGPDGTRFGQPGGQNLDFYRRNGIAVDEASLRLENGRKKGDPWPGDGDYGTIINDGLTGLTETHAYLKIHTDLNLNEDNTQLFAPTMLGPDYCRLEAVIRYQRDYYGVTHRYFAIFTHDQYTYGQGDWTNVYTLDQGAFQYQYVSANDEVIVRTTKSGSGANTLWTVDLFDVNDSTWDYVTSVYGTSQVQEGWCFWEEYGLGPTWPTLPQITARYILVKIGGSYYFVTGTEGYVRDYGSIPYGKGYNENYYEWYVN